METFWIIESLLRHGKRLGFEYLQFKVPYILYITYIIIQNR